MTIVRKFLASVALVSLVACQQAPGTDPFGNPSPNGGISKKTIGTVSGAVIGGVLGSKVGKGTGRGIAIGAGTLLGAAMGSSIGGSLDRADMQYYNQTSQKALETAQPGQTLPWQNPKTGNSGTVTPYNYYQTAQGGYCREYTQTIKVGGKSEQGYGRACRQQDGSWKIIE